MATKTWDGSTSRFDNVADWSPVGVPQPGDFAAINAGTVTALGDVLQGLNIEVNGLNGASGVLDLTDTTIAADTQLTFLGTGGIAAGQVNNQGIITARGAVKLFSSTGPTGIAGILRNTGTINVVDGPAVFVGIGRPPFGSVENDGVISVWNSLAQAQTVQLASLKGGAGLVQLFEGTHVVAPLNSGNQTFHPGDAMTLFGFQAGQSAFSWTASDGAAGFRGATIHAELGGAGTGTNASVTFAGVSLADAQSKFAISTGTTGGAGYLYVAYAA